MIAEYDIAGVFVSALVPTALIALLIMGLLRRLIASLGLYQWVRHPALADAALFLVIWDMIIVLSARV